FMHAEIVLEGNGRKGLIFALDLDAFFGFHGLVQAVGPAAAGHLAARKFVDNDDFAVLVDVIHVELVKRMRAQCLINVMHGVNVSRVGHVGDAQQPLALGEAFFGQRGLTVLLVNGVINLFDQLGNDFIDFEILVGGLFG